MLYYKAPPLSCTAQTELKNQAVASKSYSNYAAVFVYHAYILSVYNPFAQFYLDLQNVHI